MNTTNYALEKAKADLVFSISTLNGDKKRLDKEREKNAADNFRYQVLLQLYKMGWTQGELAMATGLSQARLSHILSFKHRPNVTLKTLSKIASALDCSLDVRLNTFRGQQSHPDKPLPSFKEEMMNL